MAKGASRVSWQTTRKSVFGIFWLTSLVVVAGCVTVKPSLLEPHKEVQIIWDIDFLFLDRNPKTQHECQKEDGVEPGNSGTATKIQAQVKASSKTMPKYVMPNSLLLGAMESAVTSTGTASTRLVGQYRIFDRPILAADIRRLKLLYRNYGFFRAQILPFDEKKDLTILAQNNKYRAFQRIQIRLRICEGPQARVRKQLISWTPNQPNLPDLLKALPLLPDRPYQTPRYNDLKATILQRLQQHSYALAQIKGLVLVSRDRQWVDIRLWVQPGPRCVFGKFQIYPDPDLKKRRVSKTLLETYISYDVVEGKPFNLAKLSQIQSNLFALGIFRVVNVRPDLQQAIEQARELEASGQLATKTVRVPVNIEVKEDLFQLIKLGFGFVIDGQRSQIEASLGWTFLHFLGGFRELSFRVQPGWAFLPDIIRRFDNGPDITGSISFKQPIYMDRKAELGMRVLYRRAEEIGTADFQTLTPSVWFSRPIWGKLTGRISLNVEWAFGVQNPLSFVREDYTLVYLEQQITLDLRDSPLIPTQGIYFGMTLQQAFGGTYTYFKGIADFRFYIPLAFHKNFRPIIAGRLLYGVMFSMRNEDRTGKEDNPYSLAEILRQSPLTQRFFSGGANSVRGWTDRYLGPLSCRIQEKQRRLERQEEIVMVDGKPVRRIRTIQQDTQRTLPVEPEGKQTSASQLVDKVTSIGNACRAAATRVMQSRFEDVGNRSFGLPEEGNGGVVLLPNAQQLQVVPVGGQQIMEAALELRIPLNFVLDGLSVVLFADAGAIQIKAQFEDPRELIPSVSLGGGLRFYIARIGALRLDAAARLFPDQSRYPLQQSWQIHFSFGEAF